jgi:hypothetical protein
MALRTINLGQVVNDGTGDDLRTAFEKVIFNFNDVDSRLDDKTTATNIGNVGIGIFKEKVDDDLRFKKIVGNINIKVNDDGNTVSLDLDINSTVDFNSQSVSNLGDLEVLGSINLSGSTSQLYGNVTGVLTGNVAGTVYAPIGTFGLQGNVVGRSPEVGPQDPSYEPALVDGVSVLDLSRTINNFDYGSIGNNSLIFTNVIQYLLSQIGTDMGTLLQPTQFTIDMGLL